MFTGITEHNHSRLRTTVSERNSNDVTELDRRTIVIGHNTWTILNTQKN